MSISLLFLWFMIFSLFGWIYECIFCTIKNGHWENRGFLFGPICPIYGVGAVSVIALFGLLFRTDEPLPLWEVFVISMIGSAILEYATSFLLEKIFHAIWWDYSNIPLNINGRICLPASLGFGVLGVLIYRFVLPVVMRLAGHIPDIVSDPIALFLMGVLGADLALTVSTLTALVPRLEAMENELNTRMETSFQNVLDKKDAYEQQLAESIKKYSGQFSIRESRIMRTVKSFGTHRKKNQLANRLKNILPSLPNRKE